MRISVISGGFDPIHSGHIAYIDAAASIGNKLVVLLNSDQWLRNKKDKEFMQFNERKTVLESLKNVDLVLGFGDDNAGSCIKGLEKLKSMFPEDEIIFCNGGDRDSANIPEMSVKGITFKFSVGGNEKLNSSSSILKNWHYPSEQRVWGSFFNLYSDEGTKVKELIINPQSGMSFQRHFHRSEIWLISSGKCVVNLADNDPEKTNSKTLKKFDYLIVPSKSWHQITNPFDEACKIIEIQFGKEVKETDIERLYYYENKSV